MRVRTILIAGTTVALLTAATACGGGDTTTGGTPSIASTTTAVAPPVTRSAATRATATATPTGTPATIAFRADLTIQRAGLGLLALTNTGRRAEIVGGWPKLAFRNAANEVVAVPVRDVDVPGRGSPITVGPGETVFAGVRWVVGDKADPGTFVATTVRLTPPGATGASIVRVIGTNGQAAGYTEFDLTSAQVGTLQPSSQGVLVF